MGNEGDSSYTIMMKTTTKLLRERRAQLMQSRQPRPVQQPRIQRPVIRQNQVPLKRIPGVGTTITGWLGKFGITAHSGCPCKALAREMDKVGVDKVEQEFEKYVNKMVESVRQWRKGKILVPPIPRVAIETIIRWAIAKVKKEEEEVEEPKIEL